MYEQLELRTQRWRILATQERSIGFHLDTLMFKDLGIPSKGQLPTVKQLSRKPGARMLRARYPGLSRQRNGMITVGVIRSHLESRWYFSTMFAKSGVTHQRWSYELVGTHSTDGGCKAVLFVMVRARNKL